ncbi:DUF397 domain-containing protein [Streptomyces galilaeus]|uniref:DUF397 domain-containing protein n=1 Tax=Streptomyces galilaeus TaxID=33899 RepID=UPI00123D3400|nr:DUF397 domain-containing protein [Streptomyces galilaeus]QEU67471.1 DUF397 domain-containing protein [Streptomyces galilaeus]GGW63392.1 toxin [Streptomyces galilaeus]
MSSANLTWFKSSYSSGEGGECLEAAYTWRKSTYSGGEGGECLELAACPHTINIRDSKNPTGPTLALSPAAWAHFLPYGSGSGSSLSTSGAHTAAS